MIFSKATAATLLSAMAITGLGAAVTPTPPVSVPNLSDFSGALTTTPAPSAYGSGLGLGRRDEPTITSTSSVTDAPQSLKSLSLESDLTGFGSGLLVSEESESGAESGLESGFATPLSTFSTATTTTSDGDSDDD